MGIVVSRLADWLVHVIEKSQYVDEIVLLLEEMLRVIHD